MTQSEVRIPEQELNRQNMVIAMLTQALLGSITPNLDASPSTSNWSHGRSRSYWSETTSSIEKKSAILKQSLSHCLAQLEIRRSMFR
jgi:hypothetical protein